VRAHHRLPARGGDRPVDGGVDAGTAAAAGKGGDEEERERRLSERRPDEIGARDQAGGEGGEPEQPFRPVPVGIGTRRQRQQRVGQVGDRDPSTASEAE
jgi:hypothetical protein